MTRNEFKPRLSYAMQQHLQFEHRTKHRMCIARLKYLPALQKIAALEAGTGNVVFYNAAVPHLADGMPIVATVNVNEAGEHGSVARDVLYIPEYCCLVVTVTSFAIHVYDATGLLPSRKYFNQLDHIQAAKQAQIQGKALGQGGDILDDKGILRLDEPPEVADLMSSLRCAVPLLHSQHTSTPQSELAWHHSQRELLSCGTEPSIYRWRFSIKVHGWNGKSVHMTPGGVLQAHTDKVSRLVMVPLANPLERYSCLIGTQGHRSAAAPPPVLRGLDDVLVSVGVDHRFCVWRWGEKGVSAVANKRVHDKGIQHAAHIPQGNVILTGGFDHYVQAWDLNLEDGSPVFRLPHHEGGVLGLHAFPGREQAITVDAAGMFRWWDCTNSVSLSESDRLLQMFQPTMSAGKTYPASGLVCVPQFRDLELWARGAQVGPESQRLGRSMEVLDISSFTDEEIAALDARAVKPTRTGAASVQAATPAQQVTLRSHSDARDTSAVGCGSVISCGPRLKAFELMRTTDSRSDPVGATFSAVTREVYVVVDADLKVFDAFTGTPKRLYKGILGANISCFRLDDGGRKIVMGTATGRCTVLNAYTGCMITNTPEHSHEVSVCLSLAEDNIVVSMGRDGTLRMCDELFETDGSEPGPDHLQHLPGTHPRGQPGDAMDYEARVAKIVAQEAVLAEVDAVDRGVTELNRTGYRAGAQDMVLRQVSRAHDGDAICAGTACHKQSIVASGDPRGRVRLWDFCSAAFIGEGVGHATAITGMSILHPYPALVTCDASGAIGMWDVSPVSSARSHLSALVWTSVQRLRGHSSSASEDREAEGATCMTTVPSHERGTTAAPHIALGTDSGWIVVVDFSNVLAASGMQPLDPARLPAAQADYSAHMRRTSAGTGGRPAPDVMELRKTGAWEAALPGAGPRLAGDGLVTVRSWQVVDGGAIRSVSGFGTTDTPIIISTDSLGGLTVFRGSEGTTGEPVGEILCYLHTSAATAKPPAPEAWRFPLDAQRQHEMCLVQARALLDRVLAREREGRDSATPADKLEAEPTRTPSASSGDEVPKDRREQVMGVKASDDDSTRQAAAEASAPSAESGAGVVISSEQRSARSSDAPGIDDARAAFVQQLLTSLVRDVKDVETPDASVSERRHRTDTPRGGSAASSCSGSQEDTRDDAASAGRRSSTSEYSSITHMNLAFMQGSPEQGSLDGLPHEHTSASPQPEVDHFAGRRRIENVQQLIRARQQADGQAHDQPSSKQHFDCLIGPRIGRVNTTRESLACCTSKSARRRGILAERETFQEFSPKTLQFLYPALSKETAKAGSALTTPSTRSQRAASLNWRKREDLQRLRSRTDAFLSNVQRQKPSRRSSGLLHESKGGTPPRRRVDTDGREAKETKHVGPAKLPHHGILSHAANNSRSPTRLSPLKKRPSSRVTPGAPKDLTPYRDLTSPEARIDVHSLAASESRVPSLASSEGPTNQKDCGPQAHRVGGAEGYSEASFNSLRSLDERDALIKQAYPPSLAGDTASLGRTAPRSKSKLQRPTSMLHAFSDAAVYRSVDDKELFKFAETEVEADAMRSASVQAKLRMQLEEQLPVTEEESLTLSQGQRGALRRRAMAHLPLAAVEEAARKARSSIRSVADIVLARHNAIRNMQEALHRAHHQGDTLSGGAQDRLHGPSLAKKRLFGPYSKGEVDAFKEAFGSMDADGSGTVSLQEFLASHTVNNTAQERRHYQSLFMAADTDGSGDLSLEELIPIVFPAAARDTREEIIAWVRYRAPSDPPPRRMHQTFPPEVVEQLKALFKLLDVDGNGSISLLELQEGLAEAREVYAKEHKRTSEVEGHTLAPILDDSLRTLALEAARKELEYEQAKQAALGAAKKYAGSGQVQQAADETHRTPRAKPSVQEAEQLTPQRPRMRVPPAVALLKAGAEEKQDTGSAASARHSQQQPPKHSVAMLNLMPQFMEALKQQAAAASHVSVPEPEQASQDEHSRNHAAGELSLSEFVQMLGPTFSITHKPTAAQRKAAAILRELEQRT